MKLKEFLDKYGTNTTSNFQLLCYGLGRLAEDLNSCLPVKFSDSIEYQYNYMY